MSQGVEILSIYSYKDQGDSKATFVLLQSVRFVNIVQNTLIYWPKFVNVLTSVSL